ncbi:MAG TPA: hypothetical protein GXZ87_10400 [Bacteroidales bacterium]|nr:hypothetical protein [Bacteroidales bacterium]
MKKIIIIFVAIILSLNLMNAQKQRLSIGYGVYGLEDLFLTLSFLSSNISTGTVEGNTDPSCIVGPLTISYHRVLELYERFSFGGSLTYDHYKYASRENNKDVFGFNSFTLAPEGKFKYLNPENKFNIYALIGMGCTVLFFNNYKDKHTDTIGHLNLQFTPLGLEYGRNVKGFLELGVGYKGIISGGISVSL